MTAPDPSPKPTLFTPMLIPMPDVAEEHIKVGDGMNAEPRFVIHQIVLCKTGVDSWDLIFLDEHGREQGFMPLREDTRVKPEEPKGNPLEYKPRTLRDR